MRGNDAFSVAQLGLRQTCGFQQAWNGLQYVEMSSHARSGRGLLDADCAILDQPASSGIDVGAANIRPGPKLRAVTFSLEACPGELRLDIDRGQMSDDMHNCPPGDTRN